MDSDAAKTQVQDVVSSAREKTQEQAGEVAEKGRGMLRSQVDARSTQAGQQAHALAGTLRQTAGQLRESGDEQQTRYARLADQGAQRLERAGSYLSEADSDELLARAEEMARRQPWILAGAGVLLGIAAARFMKASSTERYQRGQRLPRHASTSPASAWEGRPVPELDTPRPVSTTTVPAAF